MATAAPSLPPAQPDGPSVFRRVVEEVGDWALFSLQTLFWCVRRRPAPGTLVGSLYTVGVRTAPVVLLTGLFIGMVLAIHTYSELQDLGMATRSGVGWQCDENPEWIVLQQQRQQAVQKLGRPRPQ